jgi:hypothetical protein
MYFSHGWVFTLACRNLILPTSSLLSLKKLDSDSEFSRPGPIRYSIQFQNSYGDSIFLNSEKRIRDENAWTFVKPRFVDNVLENCTIVKIYCLMLKYYEDQKNSTKDTTMSIIKNIQMIVRRNYLTNSYLLSLFVLQS